MFQYHLLFIDFWCSPNQRSLTSMSYYVFGDSSAPKVWLPHSYLTLLIIILLHCVLMLIRQISLVLFFQNILTYLFNKMDFRTRSLKFISPGFFILNKCHVFFFLENSKPWLWIIINTGAFLWVIQIWWIFRSCCKWLLIIRFQNSCDRFVFFTLHLPLLILSRCDAYDFLNNFCL